MTLVGAKTKSLMNFSFRVVERIDFGNRTQLGVRVEDRIDRVIISNSPEQQKVFDMATDLFARGRVLTKE
jgi:hypothetical protein